MSIETVTVPEQRAEGSLKEELPPHEYVILVTKYLKGIPNVCNPCTDARVERFQQAPLVWAVRFPAPADVINQLDEIMPCAHIPDNSDISAKVAARIATPTMVDVELLNG